MTETLPDPTVTRTPGPVRSCVCGTTENLRPYPCGPRCPQHTPAALAGEPEPDTIAEQYRAALALLSDALDATPVHDHPPGQGGPCARCGATHHRYGVGGQPLCPDCRAAAA